MGIKSVFKKKEPTEDEIRDHLASRGITSKSTAGGFAGREEKFGAFKEYAQTRASQKSAIRPVNPYANLNGNAAGGGQNAGSNPYAEVPPQGVNPYGLNGSSSLSSNPSSQNGLAAPSDPYAQRPRQGLQSSSSRPPSSSVPDPYARSTRSSTSSPDPYARSTRTSTRQRDFDEESLDLNAIPSNTMYQNARRPTKKAVALDDATIDLNELPEEDDLNVVLDEELPEQEQVNSEDEEVEGIKQDIRFIKQESTASTRNTLRMAQEADASGTNTLGVLGSQSERLYNAEQNLNLADTQTKIGEEKIKQVQRLNRSIFIPASGNPFNKKSRLRSQEQRLKTEKEHEKYMRDSNRKNMYESEQRIKQGITQNASGSELHQKYRGEKNLASAQRYQFENDSEDDEMEKEIASNLEQIALYSKKLRNTANTMGQEVDSQNDRLRKIEEDADRLDINVHLNNTRLSNIR